MVIPERSSIVMPVFQIKRIKHREIRNFPRSSKYEEVESGSRVHGLNHSTVLPL